MTNTYVALLRGVNIGGNAKVEMAKLKQSFENIIYIYGALVWSIGRENVTRGGVKLIKTALISR